MAAPQEKVIRYLSLFSGIGSEALAMEMVQSDNLLCGVRFECVGYSEIDPVALRIYKQHFPTHRNLGSVLSITDEILESLQPIDLVIGGSPCQGFSQAGHKLGLHDDRSRPSRATRTYRRGP